MKQNNSLDALRMLLQAGVVVAIVAFITMMIVVNWEIQVERDIAEIQLEINEIELELRKLELLAGIGSDSN